MRQDIKVELEKLTPEILASITGRVAKSKIEDKDALQPIPQLCREMRAMAAYAEERKYIKDKEQLYKAGADRVLREIEKIFKDQPIEAAIKKAIDAAWIKIEEELKA